MNKKKEKGEKERGKKDGGRESKITGERERWQRER